MRALLAAALLATSCTAAVAGSGTPAPPSLCPAAGTDPARVVACVADDLSATWTAVAGRPVQVRVTVDPAPATVDKSCRAFLAFGSAFYCPADDRAYVTAAAVARDRREFGPRLPYALASVVAHEAGHRVQFALREPGLDDEGDAASRRVEQQADCLAGAWSRRAARRGLVDPAGFRAAYAREMELVSALRPPPGAGLDGYDEVATHGTPAQRVAAYDRGATSDTPLDACTVRRG